MLDNLRDSKSHFIALDEQSDQDKEEEFDTITFTDKTEEKEKKVDNISFLCVAIVAFLGECSRGIMVPLLWPYLQQMNGTLAFLGLVSSAFSLARFFAAPLLGYLSTKYTHKSVMVGSLILLIIGNTIYSFYPPPWLLVISRFIVGFGAGTLGQARGYVSQVTSKKDRTKYMSYLTISQFVGFAVAPGAVMLFKIVDFDLFGVERIEVDMYTSGGYLIGVCSLVCFIVLMFVFKEPEKIINNDTAKQVINEYECNTTSSLPTVPFLRKVYVINSELMHNTRHFIKSPEFKIIMLFFLLAFTTRSAVAVLETVNSVLTSNYFQWTQSTTGLVLAVFGVVGAILLLFVPKLAQKIGDSTLLLIGLGSLAAGLFMIMPWWASKPNQIQFIGGLFLTWCVGSSLCQTLLNSKHSQFLGDRPQASIMGMMASVGSIARVVGALWAGYSMSTPLGINLGAGVTGGLMVLCLIFIVFLFFSRKSKLTIV